MQNFKPFHKQDIFSLTVVRKFETKLGECVQSLCSGKSIEETLKESSARYVIVGVPEDIGVKANLGVGGADSAWKPFLTDFLNVQSNDFLKGDDILVLGYFDFTNICDLIESVSHNGEEKIQAYRHAVNTVDDEVEHIIKLITQHKKIPIIIGGGQNNAYPCIKGAAKGLYQAGILPLAQINAINLDAHADFRPAEGRHSGNGFRYADEDGYLEKYCVIGLHENYLTQNTWIDIVNDPFIDIITYEDIFLRGKRTFIDAINDAVSFTDDTYCGIELDVDCIEHLLSSASSPVGINPFLARKFVHIAASNAKVAYLHIAEGAAQLSDGRKNEHIGKMISYLVTDFIKAMQEQLANEQIS